jgi:NadR type nicotinamide-nucleotide adenylyltransferase
VSSGDGRPRRVVITGSESTGKTTLAADLASKLGVPWTSEFARAYFEGKHAPLDATDVEPIARGQLDEEERGIAAAAAGLVVHDTDLLSTMVYARHYYGRVPAWIEDAVLARRPDLYLLCHPDVPWVPGGPRDRPEHRAEVHQLFRDALDWLGTPVVDITGDWSARRARAIAATPIARGLETED